ncbi:MAG TPA: nitroreductase family protein [Dermatophilaceae bacterium]|nr:nitroreductase family protein [Dermatophilaceae bacterium]
MRLVEFTDVLRRRRMVRRFDPDRAVPPRVLDLLLRNATRAPSAGFSQGWDFVVLATAQQRAAFWSATCDEVDPLDRWLQGVQRAPVLVVCCSDKGTYLRRYAEPDKGWTDQDEARWPVPYWDIDTGMAAMLMLLSAVDQGLGALFFGVAPEHHDDVHAMLGIPLDRTIVAVVALGYEAADTPRRAPRRTRRGLAEVAHSGRFGVPYQMPS